MHTKLTGGKKQIIFFFLIINLFHGTFFSLKHLSVNVFVVLTHENIMSSWHHWHALFCVEVFTNKTNVHAHKVNWIFYIYFL